MNPGKAIILLLGLGLVIMALGTVRGTQTISNFFELSDSRDVLGARVAKLREENALLSQEILKLKKSSSYARKVLRDKYHITDDDERIVFFAD